MRIMKLLTLWLNVLATGEIERHLTKGKKIRLLRDDIKNGCEGDYTCCRFEKKEKKTPDFLPFFQS